MKREKQNIKINDSLFIYPSRRKYSKILTMFIFGYWEYGSFKFSSLSISVLSTLSMNDLSNENMVSNV